MSISYETFMKHAEKVTKTNSEARPVLKGVYHAPDGSLIAVAGPRLYKASNIPHPLVDGSVINPKTGKPVEGNFPNVSRIIPDPYDARETFKIKTEDLYRAAEIIKDLGKLFERNQKIRFQDGQAGYQSPELSISYSLPEISLEEPLYLNARFLLDAMKLFKAYGCQVVTFRYYGSVRPVTFMDEEEDLLVLILPIRVY